MAGIVPNTPTSYARQSVLDTVDLEVIQMGSNLTGVVSGCATTTAGGVMTVAVAAGTVRVAGRPATYSTATSSAMTSDPSLPKWYLITISNAGALNAPTAGTAAADPKLPAIPSNSVVVSAVYLPAGVSAITSGMIVDKRVMVPEATHANVKWFGATGDGSTDDTAAIQAAHDWAFSTGRWPVFFPAVNANLGYVITDTINCNTGSSWLGSGEDGKNSQIFFRSTDMAASCFEIDRTKYGPVGTPGGLASRIEFRDIIIRDHRDENQYLSGGSGQAWTDPGGPSAPTRTGIGIDCTYTTNGTFLKNVQVGGFYTNVIVGSSDGSTDGDCIGIYELWCPSAVKYGLHVWRTANSTVIQGIKGDTTSTSPTMEALIRVEGIGLCNPIFLTGVKHECANSTTDTIQIAGGAVISVKNVTMRSTGGRDVVRITSGSGAGVTLENITAGSLANGYSADSAVNLLNIVDDSFVYPLAAGKGVIPYMAFGGVREQIRSFSNGPQNALQQFGVVRLTGTGSYTVNLPTAVSCTGKTLTFVKTGASGTVTLDGSSSETINGATTLALTTQYGVTKLFSDGTEWFVV